MISSNRFLFQNQVVKAVQSMNLLMLLVQIYVTSLRNVKEAERALMRDGAKEIMIVVSLNRILFQNQAVKAVQSMNLLTLLVKINVTILHNAKEAELALERDGAKETMNAQVKKAAQSMSL